MLGFHQLAQFYAFQIKFRTNLPLGNLLLKKPNFGTITILCEKKGYVVTVLSSPCMQEIPKNIPII